ncbi:MAG: hypothetical protein KKF48_00210 [Nanoarchaeota archaeon]|nr:hypothetical protein [Nanoarchaeota archaeon]MBU1027447.1 hypothetical protein [Nanoarchaeota archaeon]
MVKRKEGEMKTLTVKKKIWKEIYDIKGNGEFKSMSDVVEDLLKKRKKG